MSPALSGTQIKPEAEVLASRCRPAQQTAQTNRLTIGAFGFDFPTTARPRPLGKSAQH